MGLIRLEKIKNNKRLYKSNFDVIDDDDNNKFETKINWELYQIQMRMNVKHIFCFNSIEDW